MSDEVRRDLLDQIQTSHEIFVDAMDRRLQDVGVEHLERYFALLSNLLAKLDDDDKSLKDVAREMVAESAGVIMAELAG
ncbi:MAG: hypothetical protein ACE5D3_08420 [Candidatus Binatia bacterium]